MDTIKATSYGTYDNMVSNSRSTWGALCRIVWSGRIPLARKQPLARFNAITSLGNLGKDNQRTERKLTDQSLAIGKDRVREKGRVMFGKKKHAKQEQLVNRANKKLDRAADKAVKEAKNTQEVIIANGFTLELLNKMREVS